ncbi:MAG: AAC(3) family N-acetyltransferase [Brumimicrobium sp.]|nr:AAC(3) family N-acetyltransferase [Brumimicrobium sp.]
MLTIDEHITFEELPFHLGLLSDSVVFISSDLKEIAYQAKQEKRNIDINLFIKNLQLTVKDGTIVIPAYTDYLKDGDTFDYTKSKPSTGAISNRVIKNKDFTRTKDPLHSVLIWGRDRDEIMALHDNSTFGENSIYGYLHQKNCIFIFIDVHIINSFTFIHFVEEQLKVPYRKYRNLKINVVEGQDSSIQHVLFHTKKWGVLNNFDLLNERLIQNKRMTRYTYRGIFIDTVLAQDAYTEVKHCIQRKEYLYNFSWKEYVKSFIKKILGK